MSDPGALFHKNINLVEKLASIFVLATPRSVTEEELYVAGLEGLWQAATRYRRAGGASFRTYARHRIKGAMLDWIKDQDWKPRLTRRRERVAMKEYQARMAADPTTRERVPEFPECLSLSMYDEREGTYTDLDLTDRRPRAEVRVAARDELEYRVGRIRNARHREVARLLFIEGLSQRAVGERLGVSESRVCQVARLVRPELRRPVRRPCPTYPAATGPRPAPPPTTPPAPTPPPRPAPYAEGDGVVIRELLEYLERRRNGRAGPTKL